MDGKRNNSNSGGRSERERPNRSLFEFCIRLDRRGIFFSALLSPQRCKDKSIVCPFRTIKRIIFEQSKALRWKKQCGTHIVWNSCMYTFLISWRKHTNISLQFNYESSRARNRFFALSPSPSLRPHLPLWSRLVQATDLSEENHFKGKSDSRILSRLWLCGRRLSFERLRSDFGATFLLDRRMAASGQIFRNDSQQLRTLRYNAGQVIGGPFKVRLVKFFTSTVRTSIHSFTRFTISSPSLVHQKIAAKPNTLQPRQSRKDQNDKRRKRREREGRVRVAFSHFHLSLSLSPDVLLFLILFVFALLGKSWNSDAPATLRFIHKRFSSSPVLFSYARLVAAVGASSCATHPPSPLNRRLFHAGS